MDVFTTVITNWDPLNVISTVADSPVGSSARIVSTVTDTALTEVQIPHSNIVPVAAPNALLVSLFILGHRTCSTASSRIHLVVYLFARRMPMTIITRHFKTATGVTHS